MSTRQEEIQDLTKDFITALAGRPVATIKDAARLTLKHSNTIRRALWAGELKGSRQAQNGPIRIRCRELARWVIDCERRSLPVTVEADGV